MISAKGIYPFPFKSSRLDSGACMIDSPIVNHQLVCTDLSQIMCFLIMDLHSLASIAAKVFPKLSRNEGIKLAVSANNEILNSVSAKLGGMMSRLDCSGKASITPPLVMSYSSGSEISVNPEDALHCELRGGGVSFTFITVAQFA